MTSKLQFIFLLVTGKAKGQAKKISRHQNISINRRKQLQADSCNQSTKKRSLTHSTPIVYLTSLPPYLLLY